MPNKLTYLEKPVNVNELVEKLTFDEDGLEQAASENARLLFEAGRYRVMKMRKAANRSFAYDKMFAEKRLKGRQKKGEDGKKSFTEGAVSDLALTSTELVEIKQAMDNAYAEEELSKVLLECYRVRRDMIKAIATIRASEMSSQLSSVHENMKRDKMQNLSRDVRARLNSQEEDDET